MKKTKIVATLGPASEDKVILKKMVKAGMNVARLNFSHNVHKHHAMLIANIRSVSKELSQPLAILQDLQGPRIRLGNVDEKGIEISTKSIIVLFPEEEKVVSGKDEIFVPIQYPQLYKDIKPGEPILIDDATIELKVSKVVGKNIYCSVVTPGLIKSHKGMNFPKSTISCPAITDKDIADVEFGVKQKVDFVALSFVKDAKDIISLRKRIYALEKKYKHQTYDRVPTKTDSANSVGGVHTRIIAKIERREAIENFDEILNAADGIMVARGDLGIELPFEQLTLIQKNIIEACRKIGKPVIVATQMLDSMIRNPLPTRAEVSDVANAIFDGTDAIMLSGESATGKYPLKAVEAMNKIAGAVEQRTVKEFEKRELDFKNVSTLFHILGFMAQDVAEDLADAKFIVTTTLSGFTAHSISRFKPSLPVIAVTPASQTASQLALSWGVQSQVVAFTKSFDQTLSNIRKILISQKLVKKGDKVIILSSHPNGFVEGVNTLKVEVI